LGARADRYMFGDKTDIKIGKGRVLCTRHSQRGVVRQNSLVVCAATEDDVEGACLGAKLHGKTMNRGAIEEVR